LHGNLLARHGRSGDVVDVALIHVGNFPLRSECEQAAHDATRPAVIGTPSDHAAFYCVRAYDQRVVMPAPPPG
jgi:hypothetical protein